MVKGELNYSGSVKEYFAFTPKFVKELEGTFPKSIIIAMGCQTLNKTVKQQMAEAFRLKGAKAYSAGPAGFQFHIQMAKQ